MNDSSALSLFPEVSERLGKYRLLRQLAQGGMAEIFLATAAGIEGFEKLCVIKRALPLLAKRPETVQMFLAEARIAASLQHSNIAQVFDIGIDQGRHYFVMEFLRGEDLSHLIKRARKLRRTIDFDHIVTIISSVCAALHYAHEMRDTNGKPLEIVHRDISPQNIFVTNDGTVKLCDFGIAKSTVKSSETEGGMIKGKIRYMSPEQVQEEPLDRRTDLFSLAIVMWEMVTLRHLYTAQSSLDVFMSICDDPPPPPSLLRADVPPGLEAIIMKGLRKHRDDRFQSAQELQGALEDWARAHRVPASPLRLSSFMVELFGPPAATVPRFLEQIAEDKDALTHIRAFNHHRESPDGSADDAPVPDATRDASPSLPSSSRVAPIPRRASFVVAVLAAVSLTAAIGAMFGYRSRVETAPTPAIKPPRVVAPLPKPAPPAIAPVPVPAPLPPVARTPAKPPVAPTAPTHKRSKKSVAKPSRAGDVLFPR